MDFVTLWLNVLNFMIVTLARADAIVGAPSQTGRYRLSVKDNALVASKDVGTLLLVR